MKPLLQECLALYKQHVDTLGTGNAQTFLLETFIAQHYGHDAIILISNIKNAAVPPEAIVPANPNAKPMKSWRNTARNLEAYPEGEFKQPADNPASSRLQNLPAESSQSQPAVVAGSMKLSDEDLERIKTMIPATALKEFTRSQMLEHLHNAGVEVPESASDRQVAKALIGNLNK